MLFAAISDFLRQAVTVKFVKQADKIPESGTGKRNRALTESIFTTAFKNNAAVPKRKF
jgi:hypothetical protein